MDTYENLIHTFVVIDKHYAEPSLVSLSSFKKFNPAFHVYVYCIDFNQDEFIDYVDRATNKLGLTNYTFKRYDFDMFDVTEHSWNTVYIDVFKVLSARFKIMSERTEKYFLFFDVDTIFTSSVAPIFNYVTTDFEYGAVRYNDVYPECNCGFAFLKNKHIDYFEQFKTFFNENHSNYINLDEMFLSKTHKITYIDNKFNVNSAMTVTDPIMIHYVGNIKPFEIKRIGSPVLIQSIRLYHYWYEYFDTIKDCFSDEFIKSVEEAKATINGKHSSPVYSENSVAYALVHLYGCRAGRIFAKYLVNEYKKKKFMK